MNETRSCFLDTGVFYRSTKTLIDLVEDGYNFVINVVVYYEFINTIENEINVARLKKNEKRVEKLLLLKDRFQNLLESLQISNLPIPLKWERTQVYYQQMAEYGMNIGDVLNLATIVHFKIPLLVTTDKDWKRVDYNCLII